MIWSRVYSRGRSGGSFSLVGIGGSCPLQLTCRCSPFNALGNGCWTLLRTAHLGRKRIRKGSPPSFLVGLVLIFVDIIINYGIFQKVVVVQKGLNQDHTMCPFNLYIAVRGSCASRARDSKREFTRLCDRSRCPGQTPSMARVVVPG